MIFIVVKDKTLLETFLNVRLDFTKHLVHDFPKRLSIFLELKRVEKTFQVYFKQKFSVHSIIEFSNPLELNEKPPNARKTPIMM